MTANHHPSFEGRVWRYLPHGAHALDFAHLIQTAGRWNRRDIYGCLYTSLTAAGAVAEYRKHVTRRGLGAPRQDLVALDVSVARVLDVLDLVGRTPLRSRLIAVLRPFLGARGQRVVLHLAPPVDPGRLAGNSSEDLEHCRRIADWALGNGYLALRAPSAAAPDEEVLAIFPENRPAELEFRIGPRYPLNYGAEPLVDAGGHIVEPFRAALR